MAERRERVLLLLIPSRALGVNYRDFLAEFTLHADNRLSLRLYFLLYQFIINLTLLSV